MGKRITLTFDNGPTPGVTDQVLDMLAERSLPAYFFVVGNRVENDPAACALLTRMLQEGHQVGNHSLTHGAPLGELAPMESLVEIATTHEVLAEFLSDPPLFRPWGTEGELSSRCLNQTAVDYLVANEHTCVLWNSVPRDWENPTGWAHRALADTQHQEHTVVVLHDLPTGAMDDLPRFLDELKHEGVAVSADLPEVCVPISAGRMRWSVEHLMPRRS